VFTEYNTVISSVSQMVENYGQDITVMTRTKLLKPNVLLNVTSSKETPTKNSEEMRKRGK